MNIKKSLIATSILAFAALLSAARPARATDFTVFGSYWDTEDADEAVGVGGKLRIGYVDLRATYFSDVTADTDPERRDFEISAVPLEAGLSFSFLKDQTFSPYVGAGAGYYRLDTSRGDIDDEVGYYAVAGGDFNWGSGWGLNVEAIYRNMEATVRDRSLDDPNVDEDVDLQLGGLGANVGLNFKF